MVLSECDQFLDVDFSSEYSFIRESKSFDLDVVVDPGSSEARMQSLPLSPDPFQLPQDLR